MALMRKITSVCTLGLVNYRSRRDDQKRMLNEQRKLARAERERVQVRTVLDETMEREERAAGQPWYRQPTLGAALKARRPDKGS